MNNILLKKVFAYDSTAADFVWNLGFKNITLGIYEKKDSMGHETLPGDGIPSYLNELRQIKKQKFLNLTDDIFALIEAVKCEILIFPLFLKKKIESDYNNKSKAIFYYGTEEKFDVTDDEGKIIPFKDDSNRLWPYQTNPLFSLKYLVSQFNNTEINKKYGEIVKNFNDKLKNLKLRSKAISVCFYTSVFENILGIKNVPYIISPGWFGTIYNNLSLKFSLLKETKAKFYGDGVITFENEEFIRISKNKFDVFFIIPLPSWTKKDLDMHINLIKKANINAKLFVKNYEWMFMNNSYSGFLKMINEVYDDLKEYENEK